MTVTKQKLKRSKFRKSIRIFSIIFCILFSGLIPLIDLPVGEYNDKPKIWYDPHLSDFLYDEDVSINNTFNAYNESYIICKIQNTDYTKFWFNGTQYNVSYGFNIFPVDFGNVNQSYSIDISQADVNNEIFDWVSVQPLYIDSDIIDVNLISPTNISFYAGGSISLLVQPNFSYNWLYIEVDGTIINNIYNTSIYPELESEYFIAFNYEGEYIQYDLDLNPDQHQIKFKGNGSIDYKIISSSDWDEDYLSDAEEVQMMGLDERYDPIVPNVWGYFEKGERYVVPRYYINETAMFRFFIPDTYSGSKELSLILNNGEMTEIVIDDNYLLFKDVKLSANIDGFGISRYIDALSSGFHILTYKFSNNTFMDLKFLLGGIEILVLSRESLRDSDADGIKDINERATGTGHLNPDSDFDGLRDNLDESPTSYMILKNDSICQITMPHNSSKNTIIDLNIKRPDNDYYTKDIMIWGDGIEVSIAPMLRLFGNSSIGINELETTWDKDVITYNLGDVSSTYGDCVPHTTNEEMEYNLISPEVSKISFKYSFGYEINHTAKNDNKIVIRFDVIWVVSSHSQNHSEIIHYYDFEDDILIQSIVTKEIDNVNYILASPDSLIENQILWNLIQNSELGSISFFNVSDDILGQGSVDYYEFADQINEDRKDNPISIDGEGEVNETEIVHLSMMYSNEDILYQIELLNEWIYPPDRLIYLRKYDNFISFYSNNNELDDDPSHFLSIEDIGETKMCYTHSWANYSSGETGGYEKRIDIIDFPVYMKRTDFSNAEILEISSVIGSEIPENEFPNTREDVSYDKIVFINTTIIEKDEPNNTIPTINFYDNTDEYKEIYDDRIWDVEFSKLIFNQYSKSLASYLISFIDKVKWFLFGSDKYLLPLTYWNELLESGNLHWVMERISAEFFLFNAPLEIGIGAMEWWDIIEDAVSLRDLWTQMFDDNLFLVDELTSRIELLRKFELTVQLYSDLNSLREMYNDLQNVVDMGAIPLTPQDELALMDLNDELIDANEFYFSQWDEYQDTVDDIIRCVRAGELHIEATKDGKVVLGRERSYLHRAEFKHKLLNRISGVVCFFFGALLIVNGITNLFEASAQQDNKIDFWSRLLGGYSKIMMGMFLLITGILFFKTANLKLHLAHAFSDNFQALGRVIGFIGLLVSIFEYIYALNNLDQSLSQYSQDRQVFFVTMNFLLLGLAPNLVGLIFTGGVGLVVFGIGLLIMLILDMLIPQEPPIYYPSMEIQTEVDKTYFSFNEAELKRQGGLEVGDVVNLTLSVHNNGDTMSYLHANFSAGGDYSDYEGKWEDDYGYIVDQEQTLNLTRTLSTTTSCLEFNVGLKVDSEVQSGREEIYRGVEYISSTQPVLDSKIKDFYDDLTAWDKPSTYDLLIEEYKSLLNTFQHNETNEVLNQLKQRVDYDFLDDSVGTMPSGWTATESDDGVFKTILRPNGDDLDAHKWSYSTGNDYYTEIDEDITNPSFDADFPSTVIQWTSSDYYFDGQWRGNYVKFDFTDFDSFSSCLGVKLHIAGEGNNDPEDETKFDISFDDGSSWESEKSVRIDGDYTWYTLSWSGLDESDLDDFKVRIECPDLPSTGSYSDIDVLYAEIFYKVSSIANTSLVSDYLNHNNIVNISLYGENASRSLIRDFGSSKTSGTIEFWMCKDNYTRIDVDNFFRINKLGDLVKYGTDTSIRARQIELNVWNNFKIIYTSSLFDLYLNGIKIGDYISYSDSDDTEFNFTISHDFDRGDVSKFNVSSTYIDAIDFSWSSGYYDGRSFYWDYSLENITKYENLYDNLIINTSLSTDLLENIVEMNTTNNIAEFVFDLDLVGTVYPNINITLFNIPTGFTANTTEIFQSLQDTINFKITDTGDLDYSGVYYLEMDITLSENDTIIYYEKIPFRIPLVEDLDFDHTNVIYEDDGINNGNYTATYDFLDDTVGQNPSNWAITGEPTQGTIDIISNLDGHNNVLELHDSSDTGRPRAFQLFSGGFGFPTYGTLDFWMRTDDATDSSQVILGDGGTLSAIYLVIESDKFQYYDGTWKDIGISATDDVWYHVSIDFELTDGGYMYLAQNKWQVRINGELYGSFDDALTPIEMDRLEVSTVPDDTGYYAYFDAIGYSWDDNYIIGENRFETDTIITGITDPQVAKGDVVNLEFRTNTYAEVQMKFVNNNIVQETYTILPRGNIYSVIQSKSFIVDTSITFDEIQFTEFKYNWFDVLQISITDSYSSIGTSFNPVNITNDGNAPEYVWFDISGVNSENVYSESSPSTVTNVDKDGNVNWANENNVKTQDDSYSSNTMTITDPSYVKSVEHVELTLSGVTSNFVALSKDQILANCVPFVSQKIDTTGDDWDENMVDLYFESTPSKRITGQRGEGSGTVILSIYIVEFDGVNVEVQSGTFTMSGATYDDVDITAITQSKAFPMAYWQISGNDDDWDCAMVTTDFVDDDTIRMERDQATGTISGHWYVVEAQNTEFSVQKAELSMANTDDFDIATINSVTMSKSFIVASYEANVRNEDVEEGGIDVWLNSATQVRAERRPEANNYDIPTINVFVITFSGDESVQRGSFTWGNSDTSKSIDISAVNLDNSMIKSGSMLGIMECDGGGNDDPEDSFIQYEFVDADTVRGERMGSTGEDGTGHWEVVEWVIAAGSSETESDWLRCTNFNFNIPDDAIITGIVVEIDEYASGADSIKDYSIRLRKPNGEVSSVRKSSQYWDTTDDDTYEIYGALNDTWNLDLTFNDVTHVNFGVDIAVENLGTTNTAYIDHICVKIYYSKSFVVEILPGETIEMNFDIEVPTESKNNIIHRGITYHALGSNKIHRYIDNFEIDGIYITSPLNTTYNLIGNNLSCDKNEISLEIIPEVTLTTMEYSLDGDTPTSFSGNSANVTLPEEPGMHSIQVFGLVGETEYESEIRNFTIQYPIGIVSPNETENTIFHEFLEDYDSFNSNDVNSEPDDWTVVNSDIEDIIYITDIELEYGSGPTDPVANAQVDDDTFFHITAQEYLTEYVISGTIEFNINPEGRDLSISYHIETTGLQPPIILTVNDGNPWLSGETLDFDNELKSGINTIEISGYHESTSFSVSFYFFKIVDLSKEGTVEVIESMNQMNKPVQITNNDYDGEFLMERDFPKGYETGNVSFSILRESITDKNTALITLIGTSGTMVYTLENDDLYYGTYATKTLLAENILKQDVWQEFVVFFNVSEGCQIFVDGVNTTMLDEYMDFSTGTPTNINAFKIETVYHSGEDYSFWFDNFLVNEIKGGFMLDVYNRFVFLDNLQYSFDEGAKKSFTNRELFSFPEDGLHNITIYGTDMYGDEYYSEFKIFTTGKIYEVFIVSEDLHATPDQWDDFDYVYGSTGGIGGTGSTEYDDADNYAYMNAEMNQGAGSFVYSDPSNDAGNNGWIYVPLYECINDGRRYPTTTGFTDGYLTGNYPDYFYVDMTNVVIPANNFITAIKIYGYIYTSKEDYYEPLECSYRFEGYTGWSSQGTIGGTTSWAWYSRTFGVTFGLYGDDEADALQIRFDCEQWMSDSTVWYIGAAYAQIYYSPMEYKHTSIINTTIPIENFNEIKIFYYDYATTTSVDCDLDIYNWDTLEWEELESNSEGNYITGNKLLTDAYLSDEYNVQIRFETATTLNDFDIRLDQIMVTYNTIVKKEL